MSTVVEFKNVDVIFGDNQKTALTLLDKNYDRDTILKKCSAVVGVVQASFEVKRNEIFVLMGLSGSGKSTLLRGINGLNKITRGSLIVHHENGQIDLANVTKKDLKFLRTNLCSMVFQQFGLIPWATVRENVAFGLKIKKVSNEEIKTRVDKFLKMVKLTSWSNKTIQELSGGMQQRVGLARALATDAEILLMDEPFSALDPLIREYLQNELLKIQIKLNKTIIFVSHDLNEALKLGDRIAIMKDGRIVQVGTAEEIVFHPKDDYVKKFVKNINPLTTLTAESIMYPIDISKSKTTKKVSIKKYEIEIILDSQKNPIKCILQKKTMMLNIENLKAKNNEIIVVDRYVLLGNLISIVKINHPVLVANQGKLIGLIGEKEIEKGLVIANN